MTPIGMMFLVVSTDRISGLCCVAGVGAILLLLTTDWGNLVNKEVNESLIHNLT